MHRLIFAGLLALLLTPALAQSPYPPGPPPPVPGLPDSQRQTTYTITASTCACAVGFQLYGDSTDFQNWIEVWLNGVEVQYNDPVYGWTVSSPTGALSIIPRPITDAVVTFNNTQTGTVLIVGARRPRRTVELTEGIGVPARSLNQTFNDLYAIEREIWDKTNDLTGRGLFFAPGDTTGPMPVASACENAFLGFDSTGLNPLCRVGVGSGNVVGPGSSTAGDIVTWNNTLGSLLADSGVSFPIPVNHGGTGATTKTAALANLLPTPTRAGDVTYWNGSSWVTLAGNNSGTLCVQENSSGTPTFAACGVPGGSNTQVQYNNSGSFGGISGVTTDGTKLTAATGDLVINGGSATAGLATVTSAGVVSSEANSTVAQGGTNCTSASGTCLDNITGFSSTGLLGRTGAGTYSFTTLGTGVLTAIGDGIDTNGGPLTGSTASVAAGSIVVGSGSGTAPTGVADVATGALLASGGTSTNPSYCTACTITTSLTAPTVYGGSSAGATLALKSTSNGSPSGDTITVTTNDFLYYSPSGGGALFSLTPSYMVVEQGTLFAGALYTPFTSGEASVGASATNGAELGGYGSTYDASLVNKSGSVAVGVLTGTQNVAFPGNITGTANFTGTFEIGGSAVVARATNSAYGAMEGDGSTISCTAGVCTAVGSSATAITVGTTTVGSGTSPYCLNDNSGTLGDVSCALLTAADQTLSGGANVTSASLSTGSFTVDCGKSPLQYQTGTTSAETITAPANDGSCVIQYTNVASGTPGAVTFSGFTVNSSYTGAAIDTTDSHKFMISITRINGSSIYQVIPQQ